jgi:glycosyltransferase involved in cell wall biosynthesis
VQGRPVVMSRVGGMPEVVLDGLNGLLVDPNDVRGMAGCIEWLALDWDFAQRMGAEGRRMATEQYALRIHIEKLMGLYSKAMQSRQEVSRSIEESVQLCT